MKTIKHAFLIDDDPLSFVIHSKVIQSSKLALRMSFFDNAMDALSALKELGQADPEKLPDYIFLDLKMPVIDGWGFLDLLMKFPEWMLQNTKVIILTSSIDLFDIKKAKTYSIVSDYVSKPLQVKTIAMLGSPRHRYFSISQSAVNAI